MTSLNTRSFAALLAALLALMFVPPLYAAGSPPVLDPIPDQTAQEGVEVTFTATATDPDDEVVVFSLSDPVLPGAAINPDTGVFTWTPGEAEGVEGGEIYAVTVVVSDTSDPVLTDDQRVTITVEEVNSAPQLNPVGDQTATVGALLSFTATATDSDIPAQTLTFSLAAGTAGAIPAGASITAGGAFTWTPTAEQIGDHTFDVVVADDGTPSLSDVETITVTVEAGNSAPQLNPVGDQTATVGALLSFTATATDSDIPAQTLTFSLAAGTAGAIPAGASITAGGAFTWTPTAGQIGDHTFDVVVADDGTPSLSDSETITVTVIATLPGNNLLTNAGFEDAVEGKPKRALGWQVTKLVTADGRICNVQRDGKPPLVYARTGDCAFRFKLTRPRARYVQQTLANPGLTAGQTLTAAGFIDTDRLNAGARIQALITYADNTKATLNVAIPRGTQPYRRVQNALTLAKDVSKVVLRISTGASKGTLLVDDLYLTTGALPPLNGGGSSVDQPPAAPVSLAPAADLRGN